MSKTTMVNVRLSDDDLAQLDTVRGSQTRTAAIRRLIWDTKPPSGGILSRREAMEALSDQVRAGKVGAAVALENLRREEAAEAELERLRGLTRD